MLIRVLYKAVKETVRFIYRKYEVRGTEDLPEAPFVIVGNHAQIHGPIVAQLFMPKNSTTWCIGEMLHPKEVPAYAYKDFWSEKPKWIRWYYRLSSYLIAPLAAFVFSNADVIGVYHDKRILGTFKESLKALEDGKNLVIFPERPVERNNIVYEFQDGYADLGRMYGKKTGRKLPFVPMYIAPDLRQIWFGKAEEFDFLAPAAEERKRVNEVMMERVTAIGRSLPPHTVVPYKNVDKKLRPKNR